MPGTSVGNRLTERHSAAQRVLRTRFARQLLALWPQHDPENLDFSYRRWGLALAELIQSEQATSAQLAAAYMAEFRQAELASTARPPLVVREPDDTGHLVDRLRWASVVVPKQHIAQGQSLEQAMRWGLAAAVRAGGKAVSDTGRGTVHDSIDADEHALGWRRACGPSACYFCALIATRGLHYKTKRAAQYRADGHEYHDGCNCSPEPVYTRDYWSRVPPNPAIDRAAEVWEKAAGRGKARLKDFRRLYAQATGT